MLSYTVPATYVLTDADKADVKSAVWSKVPLYHADIYDEFMSSCRSVAEGLSPRLREWKEQTKTLDVGLIRNLPIDVPLAATPTAKHGADDISMLADGVIGTISALFGSIYTIEGKGTGRHIHNIFPVIGDEFTQLGSSKVELTWHVEEAFHPARPNWISLLCLRGDAEATTKIARARDLRLQPGVLRTLRESRFKLRIDETYGSTTPSAHINTCVLTGPNSDPEIVLDPSYTVFQDERDATAVAAVGCAADHAHLRFTLMEGDLLIFNNRRVIHGRSAYSPRMNGSDRWLKRALILDTSEWTSKLSKGVIPFQFE